ncbi:hypothetical protein COCON_G00139480 [Conger conger]|uniref:Polyhomeotic-like protein 2 n=1 Tax=Conger conger TaxID=82655 RepID=A0A9Q1DAZ9_CONCO|nr:hypothetical protein COCON_G00139480 [Conger conger]
MVNVTRNVTSVTNHHLLTPACTQIQPHQLHQQQFVIQQQPQLPQRSPTPLLQAGPLQNHNHTQNHAQAQLQLPGQGLPIQPAPASQCAVPVLPKPPVPAHQATIFHSTLSPPLALPKTQPIQLTAINLQIQPALPPAPAPTQTPILAARMVQDGPGKDQPTPLVVRETCPTPSPQQPVSMPPQGATPSAEQSGSRLTPLEQGPLCYSGGAEAVNAKPGGGRHSAMTSGNGNDGPTVAGSAPQNGESKPPQAIVKPQILTHVIEGFVIQEGAEPFPVSSAASSTPTGRSRNIDTSPRSTKRQEVQAPPSITTPHMLTIRLLERPPVWQSNMPRCSKVWSGPLPHGQSDEEAPRAVGQREAPARDCVTDAEMEDLSRPELKEQEAEPMLKCELCGLEDFAGNFKRSKRFCSTVCAKRYSVRCSKRMGLIHPDRSKLEKHKGRPRRSSTAETKKQVSAAPAGGSSQCSEMSSFEEPPSPLSAASSGLPRPHGDPAEGLPRELPLLSQHFLPSDPAQWNVTDVYEFICSLPGCLEIAEEFRSQEIDGQALLLLKEDHLMSTMNIKLGPALKIFARISLLRDS